MKYFFIAVFLFGFNILNAQSINFDSLCNACKAQRDRNNFCRFTVDTTRNKYLPGEVAKEINFFNLLSTLLEQKRVDHNFKKVIKKSIKEYYVFMRMHDKLDSAKLHVLEYIFQSGNIYGNIKFLFKNKNIISAGLSMECKKYMICISKKDTANFGIEELDYDYYRTNVFPVLGRFSNSYYKCGYFYTDSYFQLEKIQSAAKKEKVKRFD